jgi:hypothetical protein
MSHLCLICCLSGSSSEVRASFSRRQAWRNVRRPAGSTRPSPAAVSGLSAVLVVHVTQRLLILSYSGGPHINCACWAAYDWCPTAVQATLSRCHAMRSRTAQTTFASSRMRTNIPR